MWKKIAASLIALMVILSPVGTHLLGEQPASVSAKGYKSGVKRYNSNKSNYQKSPNKSNQNKAYNKSSNYRKDSKRRGFLGGLMYGGIAGLLFGGLLSSLGPMGPLFGMILNVLGILLIIALVKRIFFTRRNRYEEERNQWRN
ncbi:hypothetical protein [Bacillus massilinigeriensis]|uniref:hypothetical protein n=1 Tax=Bacillus mediterraneensis TaxID=1805474 RepID=UPI0008F84505|nr:hypothetical protein [Bacillus mediterraneensis]